MLQNLLHKMDVPFPPTLLEPRLALPAHDYLEAEEEAIEFDSAKGQPQVVEECPSTHDLSLIRNKEPASDKEAALTVPNQSQDSLVTSPDKDPHNGAFRIATPQMQPTPTTELFIHSVSRPPTLPPDPGWSFRFPLHLQEPNLALPAIGAEEEVSEFVPANAQPQEEEECPSVHSLGQIGVQGQSIAEKDPKDENILISMAMNFPSSKGKPIKPVEAKEELKVIQPLSIATYEHLRSSNRSKICATASDLKLADSSDGLLIVPFIPPITLLGGRPPERAGRPKNPLHIFIFSLKAVDGFLGFAIWKTTGDGGLPNPGKFHLQIPFAMQYSPSRKSCVD